MLPDIATPLPEEQPLIPDRATAELSGADARDDLLARIKNKKAAKAIASLRCVDAYDWPRLFPKPEGFGAASDIKRRVKMLAPIESRIETLLYPGEQIQFVTRGMLNRWVEQYLLGLWSHLINQTVFLFTNYRVILINANRRGVAKVMMWQIPYDRIEKYGAGTWSGSVGFKLSDRKSYKFAFVPRVDRKRLKAFVREHLDTVRETDLVFPSHTGRDPLCPTCATPTPPKSPRCEECAEEFLNPRTPALLSLILPGLGDIYLGHFVMAVFEFSAWALIILRLLFLIDQRGASAIPIALTVLVVTHAVDALITWRVASNGVLPKRLAWTSH